MRTKWVLAFVLAFGIAAMPAVAGHKHRRGCGHVYSRDHHGWIAVNVASRNFGFSFQSAPRYDRYYDRYDDRRYDPYYDDGYRGRSRRHDRGYGWNPYRYDSHYDRHHGYWKKHHGHHHGYKGRCR